MNDSQYIKFDLQFFAKDGPGGEKTEMPTAKKLQDIRKEGQVAKSQEFGIASTLLLIFVVIKFASGFLAQTFIENFRMVYNKFPDYVIHTNGDISIKIFADLVGSMLLRTLLICAPFFAAGVVVSIVVDVAQVKWVPSAKPLEPKLSKLNPVNGFKRLFSGRKIFELIKSIAKLIIIIILVYNAVKTKLGIVFTIYDYSLGAAVAIIGDIIVDIGIRIAAFYLALAFIDYFYQKYKFIEDNKMTKQEIKDEYKNAEGDPQIKAKMKARMREASRRRMMANVPEADVVITNPTHFAVALKYDNKLFAAPVVTAKGEDHLAERIKTLAKESGVDIVENKPLARMLYYNVDIDQMIPPELYQAVAEVLAYVYSLHNKT